MFYLFANVNFTPDGYEPWQKAYDELAEHVFENEKTTQSYYFGIPFDYEKDFAGTPLMFAFEAYDNRDGLYKTHFNSPAMGEFIPRTKPVMATGFDLQHYESIGGFLDAPGDRRECAVMYDTKIVCKSAAARQTLRDRLAELARTVADAQGADTGVYTWMAFESLDDDAGVRVWERFRSREDMEKLRRRPEMVDFWKSSKENEIDRIDQRGYVPNGKGWLHR